MRYLIILLGLPCWIFFGWAQSKDINQWVQDKLENLPQLRAKRALRDNSAPGIGRQAEAPAMASASTALGDRGSASDLFGVAATLGGLGSEGGPAALTATVSVYTVVAGLKRKDPLDPTFYHGNSGLRKVSAILGYETENQQMMISEDASIFGVKYTLIDERDLSSEAYIVAVNKLRRSTRELLLLRINILSELRTHFFGKYRKTVTCRVTDATGSLVDHLCKDQSQFESQILDTERFQNEIVPLLDQADEEEFMRLVYKFAADGTTIGDLRESEDEIQGLAERGTQLALSFITKRREEAGDEYEAKFIYDTHLASHLDFVFNAGFDYMDQPLLPDAHGGAVSMQLVWQFGQARTAQGSPQFTLAGDGSWMTSRMPTYRVQGKLTLPLAAGIQVPISVTWANRTELIQESEVRGQIGFTFDFARLFGGKN